MKGKALMIAVAVVAVSAASVGVAVAKEVDTDTTFKMKDLGTKVEYSGKVSADKDKCVKRRRVEIFHRGVKIAETTTDEDGNWKKTGRRPPEGDEVTAKVKKKRRRGCKGVEVTKTFNP